MNPSIFLCLALLAVRTAAAVPPEIVRDTDHFQFIYRATLPPIDGPAKLWLPLALSGPFQKVDPHVVSPLPYQKARDQSDRNLILTFAPEPADGGKVIEITYDVVRKEKLSHAALEKDLTPYLSGNRLIPIDDTFRRVVEGVLSPKPQDGLTRGRALYDHVLQRMKYDKGGVGWGHGDAVRACEARTGNCTDFHSYFIALARAAGIPARFAIGFTIPSDPNHGTIAGYHCWAEFLADNRWVPVDISEASLNPSLADYYFGHQPANRFEFTRGRDLVVEPLPAGGPINFLVYPLLEINGIETPVKCEFSFQQLQELQ